MPYKTHRVPVTFGSIVNELLTRLNGANPPYIRTVLHEKLEELCTETHCWIEHSAPVDIEAGTSLYPIPVAYDARILCVRSVQRHGRTLNPKSYALDLSDADAPLCTLHCTPTQDAKCALSFTTALAPLSNCENFPDGFLERYRQTLKYGVLASMQAEEGKPYSRQSEAAQNHVRWQRGIHECNVNRLTQGGAHDLSALSHGVYII